MKKHDFQLLNSLMILVICLLAALSGCSGENSGGSSQQQTPMDMDKLAAELQEQITFEDTMSPVDSSVFYVLYGLTEEDSDAQVMIGSTGATAEEIAVIHAASPDKVETILEAVKQRVQDQREGFENYVPKELEKLSEPVIRQVGDTVVLCVSNDNETAERIIDQYE